MAFILGQSKRSYNVYAVNIAYLRRIGDGGKYRALRSASRVGETAARPALGVKQATLRLKQTPPISTFSDGQLCTTITKNLHSKYEAVSQTTRGEIMCGRCPSPEAGAMASDAYGK